MFCSRKSNKAKLKAVKRFITDDLIDFEYISIYDSDFEDESSYEVESFIDKF